MSPSREEELRRAKDHLKGATLLASRRQRRAHEQPRALSHVFRPPLHAAGTDCHARKGDAEEVQQIAREFFQPERIAASVVGNLNGFELTRDQLTF